MGLIDRLFGRPRATGGADTRFETLTAYSPTFTSWGGQIYESELVRAAVDARARHVGKLKYTMEGPAQQKLWTATKSEPNPWYTTPSGWTRAWPTWRTIFSTSGTMAPR